MSRSPGAFFSRVECAFMSLSGRSTSMSFLRYFGMVCGGLLLLIGIGLYMKFRANLYGFLGDFLGIVLVFHPLPALWILP